jgi:nucleoside-diphosphate-sugar epimerase
VLVTGAAGFKGFHLAIDLLARGTRAASSTSAAPSPPPWPFPLPGDPERIASLRPRMWWIEAGGFEKAAQELLRLQLVKVLLV